MYNKYIMKKYLIIGPAASGKDWLQHKFVEKGYKQLVSYTTRPQRPNENGTEYHFISSEEMGKMIRDMKFVSLKNFISWWYGFTLEDFLDADIAIVTVGNLEDIEFSRKLNKVLDESLNECEIVYLDIPENIRRTRLDNRYTGGNPDDSTNRRIEADKKDFEGFSKYTIKLTSVEDINNYINNIPTCEK